MNLGIVVSKLPPGMKRKLARPYESAIRLRQKLARKLEGLYYLWFHKPYSLEKAIHLESNMQTSMSFDDLASIFGADEEELRRWCYHLIEQMEWGYEVLSDKEVDRLMAQIKREIGDDSFKGQSGREFFRKLFDYKYKQVNNSTYAELLPKPNVKSISRNKRPVLRLHDTFIIPNSIDFVSNMVEIYHTWLYRKYYPPYDSIHEFGFGSGGNLVKLALMYPDKQYYGYEWVEPPLQILDNLRDKYGWKMYGALYDMLEPSTLNFGDNDLVFTHASMELLGKGYEPFVYKLIEAKPKRVIHTEPIVEFYTDSPMGNIAKQYGEARGFLWGFLSFLRGLEKKGLIKISLEHRVPFGNKYHEAYNLIIWEPLILT